jgi:hypothetical protein
MRSIASSPPFAREMYVGADLPVLSKRSASKGVSAQIFS